MKESFIALSTVYIPMVGVPVLLFGYALSLFIGLKSFGTVLLALSMIGLAVFGASGFRDVYLSPKNPHEVRIRTETVAAKPAQEEKNAGKNKRTVIFRVMRFHPETQTLKEEDYAVETDRFSTVLEGLLKIKAENDPTLAVRYSCRMGICGSCGMVINGKPSLACEKNVWGGAKDGRIEISPMLGHPLLKDLVTDFDDFFEKHILTNPYLFRTDLSEKYNPTKEYPQTKGQLDKFLPFSYCIMCGLCVDACPVINTNPDFIGPQALSQVYRYYADSRDEAGKSRLEHVDLLNGVWDCEFSGSCSEVCPKGVDPAFAIQLLKTEIIKNGFALPLH